MKTQIFLSRLYRRKNRVLAAVNHLLPLFGGSPKHQANSHNIHTEDLVQTFAGAVLQSLWDIMHPTELIQWAMLSWSLLSSLIPAIIPAPLSTGLPELQGKNPMSTYDLTFTVYNVWLWFSESVPIYCQKSLWWQPDKVPVYEYKEYH